MSNLVEMLDRFKELGFIHAYGREDKSSDKIWIDLNVRVFKLSHYQEFFKQYGYVVKDAQIYTTEGIVILLVEPMEEVSELKGGLEGCS